MSFDYSDLIETADDLIGEFGISATLRRKVASTFDPVAGVESDDTYEDHPVNIIVLPVNTNTTGFDNSVNSEWAAIEKQSDRFCFVAANGLSVVPEHGDTLITQAESLFIIGSTPVSPGGADIVYRVGMKVL